MGALTVVGASLRSFIARPTVRLHGRSKVGTQTLTYWKELMDTQPVAGVDLDRLFQWQERAIDAWERANRRGIVEGMTGTGKTILAIKAVKRLQAQGQRVSPLIVVPTVALLDQWCTRLRKDFPDCPIGRIGDGSHGSFAAGDGGALPVVCVSTIHSAVPAAEQGLFDHCRPDGHRSFLVADECHRYLNEDQKLFNRILRRPYDYTLGLSATVERFEVEGLGRIVYTYDINDAVRDGVIPHFDVLNVGINLRPEELTQYLELDERIRNLQKKLVDLYPDLEFLDGELYWRRLRRLFSDDDPVARALLLSIFKRAAISYTAAEKLKLVPQIIELLVNKAAKKMLVFFERIWTAEAGQEDVVRRVAEQVRDTVTGRTGGRNDDPVWCKLFHSEMKGDVRSAVLEEFRGIGPSALLACRALDEGLDVPAVDAAMLVASTQSPRQRLQRIGRTLRRGDGRKRPLIVILYVNGTSDTNVRIDPNDPDFKEAATVFDAGPKDCVGKITEILGIAAPAAHAKATPRRQAIGVAEVTNAVGENWELMLEQLAASSHALKKAVASLPRKTAVKLELTDGTTVFGEWRMLSDDLLFLERPARQVAARRVSRLWRSCLTKP
jgi:superfamily II DNA or RNA helicase